jgi:hypothetical protein
MSWPHKEDGTIDWNTVFDDPNVGLESLVGRAHSPEALSQCAHVIVHSLFIREEDAVYRKAFNHMIDELIQSTDKTHDSPRMHDLVLKLIHEIKANRIKHAQRYLDEGSAKGGNGGRTGEGAESRRAEHDPTDALRILKS